MRIMILNHQSKREGSPEYEAGVTRLLAGFASPGTTLEVHYPEDLGGTEVTSHLRKNQALAGLHHALETPALVKKIIEAERSGFDAVVLSNTFDPGVEVARCAVRIPVIGVLRVACPQRSVIVLVSSPRWIATHFMRDALSRTIAWADSCRGSRPSTRTRWAICPPTTISWSSVCW